MQTNQSGNSGQPWQNVTAVPATFPTASRDQLPFTNESLTNLNPNLPTLFITGDSTAARSGPAAHGWGAIRRPGPYCCAEVEYGGFGIIEEAPAPFSVRLDRGNP